MGGGAKENEGRGGKTQAGRRDIAIDPHCQNGEAINNIVTMKRERGRVWRSKSRVYKRNTTKPSATGASSCRALMGVRSGWLSILCLTAHSSADGPRHPWPSATHLFNRVYTLKGDTVVEVERWKVREKKGVKKTAVLHLFAIFLDLLNNFHPRPQLLLHYSINVVILQPWGTTA